MSVCVNLVQFGLTLGCAVNLVVKRLPCGHMRNIILICLTHHRDLDITFLMWKCVVCANTSDTMHVFNCMSRMIVAGNNIYVMTMMSYLVAIIYDSKQLLFSMCNAWLKSMSDG